MNIEYIVLLYYEYLLEVNFPVNKSNPSCAVKLEKTDID